MHRLDRRLRILRGKRETPFNPRQYEVERAARARAARRVRFLLRRMTPVVLLTPRWSEARDFLDDVAVDLSVGRPRILCRTLSMAPMDGRSVYDGRQWLTRAIIEFCELYVPGPVWQAVDRNGFRTVMRDLLRRARTGPRRALLMHGLEHLHVEALADFVEVFREHVEELGEERRLNVVLGGSVDTPGFDLPGAGRVVLPDYSAAEAEEVLVETLGPTDPTLLRAAVGLVGGVPALLRAVAHAASAGRWVTASPEELVQALGPLRDEVSGALEIVRADGALADRLEQLAAAGSATAVGADEVLLRAGIAQRTPRGAPPRVAVRAPVFSRLLAN